MDERERRRAFQRVKGMTNDKFWAWMNWLHSQAYAKGVQHVREAMECHPRISQRMVDEVITKSQKIREEWDGIKEITMDETEGTELQQVMRGKQHDNK